MEEPVFKIDEANFIPELDFDEIDKEEEWNRLVDQILKGNVIPVINDDMVKIGNLSSDKFLLQMLVKSLRIHNDISSYNALQAVPELFQKQKSIHSYTSSFIEKYPQYFQPTDLLRQLLSIPYFPFVLTTTVDPIVENTMREIHGDKLRTLVFTNDSKQNEDIQLTNDTNSPTLYYMFGKACNQGRNFVLTDNDLMKFARSWLLPNDNSSNAKPANLANALADKFLLVLGNKYKDWLFRFLWLALKDEKVTKQSTDPNGMNATEMEDNEVIEFLNNANITSQLVNLPEFVTELRKRIDTAAPTPEDPDDRWFQRPIVHADIFISYSRADAEITKTLYDALTAAGLTVWYDKKNLCAGDDFKSEIRDAIRYCKIFIPILTTNILRQAKDPHVYRLEWAWALEQKALISPAVRYIVPFSEASFNIDDELAGVPEGIRAHNTQTYSAASITDDLSKFVQLITSYIQSR